MNEKIKVLGVSINHYTAKEAMKKVIAVLCICGLMGLTAGLPLSRAAAEEKTERTLVLEDGKITEKK